MSGSTLEGRSPIVCTSSRFTKPDPVQCEGFPCKRCSKAGRICTFYESRQPQIRLGSSGRSESETAQREVVTLPVRATHVGRLILPDQNCSLLTHFYLSFLALNSFTGGTDDFRKLHSLLQDSPTLFNAAIAVSALHVGGQDSAFCLRRTHVALQSYRTAVSCLRRDLDDRAQRLDDSTLWSTFLLGMFEVLFLASCFEPRSDDFLVDVRAIRRRVGQALPAWYRKAPAMPWT